MTTRAVCKEVEAGDLWRKERRHPLIGTTSESPLNSGNSSCSPTPASSHTRQWNRLLPFPSLKLVVHVGKTSFMLSALVGEELD